MYSRVATFVSIVSGALLGALAALISVTPARPAPEAAATPAQPASPISEPAGQATSPDAGVPHAATRPPPKALDPEKLSKLSERCTSGDGHACLDAASAWEATGAPDDAARAKDHLKKAARIYINRCVGKDPVACAELAMLNASGRGVEKNERNASALRVHAQVLCRRHPKPECKDVLARAEAAPDVPASH